MKLIALLIIINTLSVSASIYGQESRVTLDLKNKPLSELINHIKKQTNYSFLYDSDEVNVNNKVNITSKNITVKEALAQTLKPFGLESQLNGNHILIVKSIPQTSTTQQREITGVVRNTAGQPISDASISIKGTSTVTKSDANGFFKLSTSRTNFTIIVSNVGMQTVETEVSASRNHVDIVLSDATVVVDEIVVTALGMKRQSKSLSYNVQQIDANDALKIPDPNFVNNLNGRIAGVTINSSSSGVGGSSRVVLRGSKSISGNNNALYVIDGIPMPSLSSEQLGDIFSGAGQTGDGISNFNADDIESISVLSGPAAAALYGSAAANGVILVTTKSGNKESLSISFSNQSTLSNPLMLPKLQTTYKPTESGSYYSWGDKLATPSTYDVNDFFINGMNITNSLSLSSGNEKSQTYVSIGNVDANGIIHNNNYNRYNFSVRNTTNLVKDKLVLDVSFMNANVKEQNMTAQGLYFNPLVPLYLFPAGDDFNKAQIFERYDASRNFKTQFWPYGDQGLSMQNPYWITERALFPNKKERYISNASLRYVLNDWLNLTARAKLDRNNDKFEKKFNASTNLLFASENGFYSLNEAQTQQIFGEFIANINKNVWNDKVNITGLVGTNIEDLQYDQNMYGGKLHGVPNLFTYANVNNANAEYSQSGYRRNKQAVFASAQIGYQEKVFLDLNARNDWSSTLANSNTKSFFYPSLGLSAIISDIFNMKSNAVSLIKLRGSYSEVGNDPSPFLTIPTYSLSRGYPQTQTRMPNTDLKPERTRSYEAGINLGFFRNKWTIDATAYLSNTFNQFFEPTLSSSSGYTSVIVNAGQIDNKGIEVTSKVSPKIGNVDFSSFVTFSLNRNKIIELLPNWKNPITGEQISLTELDMTGTGSYKMVLKEGGSMGDIYVNTLRVDEHGAIYVHPTDQTVVAETNEFVYAGNSNPRYNVGWGSSINYKGLQMGFMFNGRFGGVVVSNTQAVLDFFGASQRSADAREAGGVIVNGRPIPTKPYYDVVGGGSSGGIGSMYTYSADNIRLGEVNLGYTFPISRWTTYLKSVNISLIGKNLLFLYNKAPYDPELTASTGTYFQGIDYFMSPSLRSIGFSLKVQL